MSEAFGNMRNDILNADLVGVYLVDFLDYYEGIIILMGAVSLASLILGVFIQHARSMSRS